MKIQLIPIISFHHIWVWRPSWSCDPDATNKTQGGSTENLALICPAVSEKKMFKHCGRMDDGQMPEHGYTISSPMSLRLR